MTKKKPATVGIDISASSVKVLELSREGEHYRVERYAVEPLPQNAIVEHAITEIEQVAETIGRALKRSGTRTRRAAIAMAASHVICKSITAPRNLGERELQAQIEMDADHYIPYPLDEVNLDFQTIGPSEDNPEENEVLVAACRKEIIDDYIAVLQGNDLIPAVIDIETYAMENAFALVAQNMAGGGMEKTVAIFDIGAV
ncbi:MAG: type IV pilus assembly protein PilM, partial [Acidiferrobacteraceae bacterium]